MTSDEAFKAASERCPTHEIMDSDLWNIWNAALEWAKSGQEPVAYRLIHACPDFIKKHGKPYVSEWKSTENSDYQYAVSAASNPNSLLTLELAYAHPAPVQPASAWVDASQYAGEQAKSALDDALTHGIGIMRNGKHVSLDEVYQDDSAQPAVMQLDQIEQYRMQMVGISTASFGYWKEGDTIHPDYDTLALRDVAALYKKYAEKSAVVQQLLEVVETVANNIGEFAGQLQTQRQVDQLSEYASQLFDALKAVKENGV